MSEALRIKAALNEIKNVMDNEFEEAVDEDAIAEMEVEDQTMFAAEPDEDEGGGQPASTASSSARFPKVG